MNSVPLTAGFGVTTDYAKVYEMAVAQKVKAILFAPLLPAAVLIDILVGDLVTGVEMPWRDKLREHRAAWLRMWNKTPNAELSGATLAERPAQTPG